MTTGDMGTENLRFNIEGNSTETFEHLNRILPTLSNNLQTIIRQFALLDETFAKSVKGIQKQSVDELADQVRTIEKRLSVLDAGTNLRGKMAGAYARSNNISGEAYEQSAIARERRKVLKAESDRLYNDVFSGRNDTGKAKLGDLNKEELSIRKQAHLNAMAYARQSHDEAMALKHKQGLELIAQEEETRAKALRDQKKAEKDIVRQEAQEAAEARAKRNRELRQEEYDNTPTGRMQKLRNIERANFIRSQDADSVVRLNERERLSRMKAKAGEFKSIQDMILSNSYGETYSEEDLKTADKTTLRLRQEEIKRQLQAAGLVRGRGMLENDPSKVRQGENAIAALQGELEIIKQINSERKKAIHSIRDNFNWSVKNHEAGQSEYADARRLLEIRKQLGEANRLANDNNNTEDEKRKLTAIIHLLQQQRKAIQEANRERDKVRRNDRQTEGFEFQVKEVDLTQTQNELIKEQHKIKTRLQAANKQLHNAEARMDTDRVERIHDTIAALKRQQEAINDTLRKDQEHQRKQREYQESKKAFDRSIPSRDLASLSEREILNEKIAANEKLAAIKRQLRQANKYDNQQEQDELKNLIELTRDRIEAIRDQEEAAKSSDYWQNRTNQIISPEGSGSLLLIQSQLAANYAILSSISNLIQSSYQYLRDFETALLQTQAITQATSSQIVGLKDAIFEVSETTKFTSIELAQATTVLAQAGFSLKEIQSSLSSVALLATATGSSLENTVDIATSVLGAFQMTASQLPTVVNQITQAMNLSKLDIEKFQLAIQYAGNAAADAGLSFRETLASVATVANTGVRSGSTLGTGFRQLINDLKDPTEDFLEVLQKLGLGLDDVNIRAHGFAGVVDNLKKAGFTTSDAFKSFEVRAVSFFTAMANNLNLYEALDTQMNSTTAAAEANAIQMASLDSQLKRTSNQFLSMTYEGLEPTIGAFTQLLHLMGNFLAVMREVSGSGVVQYGAMTVAAGLLAGGMLLVISRLNAARLALIGYWRASMGAAGATASTAAVLRSAAGGWAIWTAAIMGAMVALEGTGKNLGEVQSQLEGARTKFNEMKDTLAESEAKLKEVDNKIYNLNARFDTLKENPALVSRELEAARESFNKFGVTVQESGTDKVNALIEAYKDLRVEIAKELVANVGNLMSALNSLTLARGELFKTNTEGMKAGNFNRGTLLNPEGGLFASGYALYSPENLPRVFGANYDSMSPVYEHLVSMAKERNLAPDQMANLATVIENMYAFNERMSSPDFGLSSNLASDSETYNKLAPAANKLVADMLKYLDAETKRKKDTNDKSGLSQMVSERKFYADLLAGIELGGNRLLDLRQAKVSQDALVRQEAKSQAVLSRAKGTPQVVMGKEAQRINDMVEVWKIAEAHGVPFDLVMAMIERESQFNPRAVSPAGAQGLMQLMPATAKRFGVKDSFDPKQNVQGGVQYLAWLLKRFKGDEQLALAAYNAGEGNVDKYGGIPPFKETKDYVRIVQSKRAKYQGQPEAPFDPASGIDVEEFYYDPLKTNSKVEDLRRKKARLEAEQKRLSELIMNLKKGSAEEIKKSGELQAVEDEIVTNQEALRDAAESFNVAETKLLEKRKKQAKLDVQYADREVQDYQNLIKKFEKAGELQKAEDARQKYLVARKKKFDAEVKALRLDNTMVSAQDSAFLVPKKDIDFGSQALKRDYDRDVESLVEGRTLAENERIKSEADAEFKKLVKEYKESIKREREAYERKNAESDLYIKSLDQNGEVLELLDAKRKVILKEKDIISEGIKKGKYSSYDLQAKERELTDIEKSILAEEYNVAVNRRILLEYKSKELDQEIKTLKDKLLIKAEQVAALEDKVESGDATQEMLTLEKDQLNTLEKRIAQLERTALAVNDKKVKTVSTIEEYESGKREVKPLTTREIAKEWAMETTANLDSYETKIKRLADTANKTSQSLAQMFTEIMDGSKDAADAVEDFGKRFVAMVVEMAMQEAAARALAGFIGLFGGSSTSAMPKSSAKVSPFTDFFTSSGITAVPMNRGGEVKGSRLGYDSVPTLLKPKEYVLPVETTNQLGKNFLDGLRLNPKEALNINRKVETPSFENTINLVVVTPENKPTTVDKNDIVIAVTDDIARNGQISQVIKQKMGGR